MIFCSIYLFGLIFIYYFRLLLSIIEYIFALIIIF